MISENLLLTILFISLFLELTLIPFPVVFLVSLVLYILYPRIQNIVIAASAGVVLDILNVSILGKATLFILIAFLVVDLYRRAFEAKNPQVLLIILAVGTYIYARVFSYSSNFLVYVVIFGMISLIISYFSRGRSLWFK